MSDTCSASPSVAIDGILFQMLFDSCDEIRRLQASPTIYQAGGLIPGALRERVPPWRRGQIINSAAYIRETNLQGRWTVPRVAVDVSRQILEAEAAHLEELQAASLAGTPWQGTFDARLETCVRCGETASWRFILKPPPNMPVETAWRLSRPENAVPICRRCVETTRFQQREEIRFDLAWGLWATRFEALHRWYLAVQYDWLPRGWKKEEYPLWPGEYGGSDWKEGSGSYIHCVPKPPRGVWRSPVHFAALHRAMGVAAKRREKNGPYFSALQLQRVTLDTNLEPGEFYCERGCVHRGTGNCSYCSRNRDGHTKQPVQEEQA